jgi:hypothetical protein
MQKRDPCAGDLTVLRTACHLNVRLSQMRHRTRHTAMPVRQESPMQI